MTDPAKAQDVDPFLLNYDAAEVRIAAEFLSNWLPFLSRGLCKSCTQTLSDGIRSLHTEENFAASTPSITDGNQCKEDHRSWKDEADGFSEHTAEPSSTNETFNSSAPLASPTVKKSWADMALEDDLAAEENEVSSRFINMNDSSAERTSVDELKPKVALSRDQREYIRFSSVQRKKDFICLERVNGKFVNILDGLELHKGVFSAAEQKRIVSYVEQLEEMGRNGQLKERTFSAPQKCNFYITDERKGRILCNFWCCYNVYAVDKNGNPPGILKNETVDPLPHLFKL
ncbi:RNA demethylase ALKB [Sesamum alatum]|uniref:RNA demethylase ALKB n=1 Tax=Sesamum alatum TaxID=300844 RepID=A0AAE2CC96_9LAMI|nr:RNA demethylase ALKB [Sesamum alatum]